MPQPQSEAFLPAGYVLRNTERGLAYQIVRLLGHGGFGVTYEARDSAGRRVAVKELFPSTLTNRGRNYGVSVNCSGDTYTKIMNSFRKEAVVISELAGIDSVVKIYDYFFANNTAYYVMEFIGGSTLLSYMKKNGVLDPVSFGPKFQKLMGDIQLLHQNGVLHRDISPDNIMLRDDGGLKLIDFGSARFFEGSQNLTVNLKADFAPLEQYSPSGQGPYTDVYSMAATMYYCFTGRRVPSCLERMKRDELTLPSELGIPLSQEQEAALVKALALKYADRYQSMRDFSGDFFRRNEPEIKTVQPVEPAEPSWLGYSWAVLKAKPALLALCGVLLGAAVALQFIL